ncbi:MAG: NUDIX hydrolase [Anaerolineales bacterium]
MPFSTIAQEIIYRGHAFNLRRDELKTPDQRTIHLDIIEHVGAVTLLPVDVDGRILFVRQYRHATGKELLELPAGTLNEGELPEACANREIREETGFAAGKLQKLGQFFLAPGYSTEYMLVFLATDLRQAPLPGDQDEFITLQPIPVDRAYEMALNGELQDGKSLAALLLARPYFYPA